MLLLNVISNIINSAINYINMFKYKLTCVNVITMTSNVNPTDI